VLCGNDDRDDLVVIGQFAVADHDYQGITRIAVEVDVVFIGYPDIGGTAVDGEFIALVPPLICQSLSLSPGSGSEAFTVPITP
jgi:hypothetical protein